VRRLDADVLLWILFIAIAVATVGWLIYDIVAQ
jgi:hypothetical protein